MIVNLIMPCTLQPYKGAASNRKEKLDRAIKSFLNQDYENKNLIIVADGCQDTIDFVKSKYSHEKRIKSFFIYKQPLFSGNVRQFGLNMSGQADLIAFLDSDDFIKEKNHISNIVRAFEENTNINWVYFNDYVKYHQVDHIPLAQRESNLSYGSVGVSNVAHRNIPNINWELCDGYGHDFTFVKKLIDNYPDSYAKIQGCSYVCCHIPESCDS